MEEETGGKQDKLVPWGWGSAQYIGHIWTRYGLKMEGFQEFWNSQDGKCAGCEGDFAHPKIKQMTMGLRPEVDHDHKTGIVRGLLCRRCNDFLGKIRDNRQTLKNLEAYLKRNGETL